MQPLAALLRDETHSIHRRVENSAFMAALLSGKLEKSAYVLLLRNLEPIYAALEWGLMRHADAPTLSLVLIRPLFRLSSLHRDLEFLQGASWRSDLPLVAAGCAYVNHLRSIEGHAPDRLAAHAYVRYLGDLRGGQMLRKVVVDSLKLPDHSKGVDFYHFGEPLQVAALVAQFRAGLNLIEGTENGYVAKRGLLDEAQFAFELHLRLFDDLAITCGLLPNQATTAESSNPAIECPGPSG